MPRRLAPPCTRPGCEHSKPCPVHARQQDRQRGTAAERGYGHRHREKFRAAVLERQPVCVLCLRAPSEHADHWPLSRRQLEAQGLDADDPAYGRGLCATCHNRHTAETAPGGWNAERPPNTRR